MSSFGRNCSFFDTLLSLPLKGLMRNVKLYPACLHDILFIVIKRMNCEILDKIEIGVMADE